MAKKEENTEKIILKAAREVFVEKGMDGARMQEIADRAAINKALLHYYFRSKDKLFDAVFEEIFSQVIPRIGDALIAEFNLEKFVRLFIDMYADLLYENPFIPQFILSEIYRNPERIRERIVHKMGIQTFVPLILAKLKTELSIDVDPRHFVVSVISLIIFPYAGKPLIQMILFQDNDAAYKDFLIERREFAFKMIMNYINEIKNNSLK
jgi:TetR/AcrR family transcriptional regulator